MSRASHVKKMQAASSPAELAARDRRIARAVQSGLTLKDASRRFAMDVKIIGRICAEQGVRPAKGRPT